MSADKENHRPHNMTPEEEEYRRRQEAKAARRKKRRMQKILLLASFALAAVLLVLCIVMVVRAIIGPKKPASTSLSGTDSSITSDVGGISWPVAVDPNVWNLILVNPQVPMPDGFKPELATVSDIGHTFDARASDLLKQMVADCNAVEGHSLEIDSGYRGPDTQNKKYNDLVASFVAQGQSQEEAQANATAMDPPYGYSDHQTGLGVDFKTGAYQQVDEGFAQTPEYAWLMEHCTEYGFVLRFPENKTAITGIGYQPFHFRYVGKDDAIAIMSSGICLEEYLMALPQTADNVPPEDTSDVDA